MADPDSLLQQAVELIRRADGLLVTAGAGMGVDSGLPDFRGPHGFWGVYPALGRARLHFEDIACPQAFEDHPRLAWGFEPEVDAENCLITSPLPHCPRCSVLARPNILMFGDWGWLEARQERQMTALGGLAALRLIAQGLGLPESTGR